MDTEFINVYVSRLSNDRTKPRLFSPLIINEVGPLVNSTGFRFRVSPDMTKEEIVTQCSEFSAIKFDTRPEVHSLMFLSSIIIGWAYRVKITGVYHASRSSEALVRYLFPMICTLLKDPYARPVKRFDKGDDGWTTVKNTKRVSRSKSAYCYAKSILDNTSKKDNWKGIFDVNFQLTILAIAMGNEHALKAIESKFHAKFMSSKKKDELFNREVNKFKIFNFLTSYY